MAADTQRAPWGRAGKPWLSRSAPAISRTWLPRSRKVPPAQEELRSQQHHHTEVTVQSGALSPGQGRDPPKLQTALAHILRPSGNTGLNPCVGGQREKLELKFAMLWSPGHDPGHSS